MYSWDLFLKSMIQTVVFQTKRWTYYLDKQHTDYNHMQIYKKTKEYIILILPKQGIWQEILCWHYIY